MGARREVDVVLHNSADDENGGEQGPERWVKSCLFLPGAMSRASLAVCRFLLDQGQHWWSLPKPHSGHGEYHMRFLS
jgi:hypothetical protein